MNGKNELYLTDLISVDILQRLQDAFSEMTGMAALTTDKYGMPVTEGSNFSEFCTKYTRNSPLGYSRCMRCDKTGAELTMASKKACFYHCHAGLVDYAAPIIANGEMIGSFIGGQVLAAPPNLEAFEKTALELGIDPELYVEAVKKINIVDDDTIDKAANFLCIVAECLSHLAYQGYELHKSNIEIERVSNLKSDFLANMSHEIRTPMNAVLGMVDLALREQMSDAARECMHQIKMSAKNLLVIINDILDFSKIESGKMDIIEVAYEPLSVINDLSAIARNKIGNKEIEFTMNIAPDMPQTLYGDNVRIHQILLNLITNAVKFTQRGEVHLDLTCERENDELVTLKVSVTDTGMGIKESDFSKLFNSFQQVDSKRNRNIEGTGLGLVICKQLLELMGGAITVKSEYGKGSTFTFLLPQKIIDKTPAVPRLEKEFSAGVLLNNPYARKQLIKDLEWIGAKPVILSQLHDFSEIDCDYLIIAKDYYTDTLRDYLYQNKDTKCIIVTEYGDASNAFYPNAKLIHKPIYSLSLYNAMGISDYETKSELNEYEAFTFIAPEACVLIVDDNSVNLKVAKGLIEPLQMVVDTAESASKAIEMVSRKKYDMIFMDHMMPEVDGVEATHIIRRMLPSYKEVPIIALTANAVGEAKNMFLREGMNDFVAKPIEIKDIVSKIRKWLPQEKIKPVSSKEQQQDTEVKQDITEITGLNVKQAIELLGSEKLFKTVLREYFDTIEQKAQKIRELRWAENWENYTIEVHSLKSTSRQIGAEYVGDLAAELEMAGKTGDYELIKEKSDHMIDEYTKYIDILSPIFEGEDEVNSGEELYELLGILADVITTFDILAIDEVIEKIEKSNISDEDKQYFNNLKKYIDEADIDKCNETIENWRQNVSPDTASDKSLTNDMLIYMLENLQTALNNFDILAIDEAVEALARYTYPDDQQELLLLIKEFAHSSDIDNCSEAASRWHNLLLN